MADNGHSRTHATPHVAIVGGGIAGLAAAFFLRDKPVRVTVIEGSSRVGGKLAMADVAGVAVDVGADSTYAPRAKGTGMIAEAGLDDQLTSAGTISRGIWSRGEMRPLPSQHMGVPSDLDELAKSGVLTSEGAARALKDLELPPAERNGDISVAEFVGRRLGQEVVDRLVDPWLGGVYSGRSEELSFEAALPTLARATKKHASLAKAASTLMPQPLPDGKKRPPGISTLLGGIGTLPKVLSDAASAKGAALRTNTTVRELARTGKGWRLTVGSAAAPEYIDADAVIVAVPAGPAGKLLSGVAGVSQAVAGLAEIEYATIGVITFAYPRDAFPVSLAEVGRSGYMVPAVDGRLVQEVTFSSVKWPHLAGEVEIVRCAIGRKGDEKQLERDDAELAAQAAAELAEATGVAGKPVGTQVTRWENAMPQYTVGHLDRVARIRASVADQPGLAVCGAAYDGVGVATCVATAQKAVDQVLTSLNGKVEVV
ncbi:protoporphyrinogen oxidase [Kibdelosporangium aridum]|uniref:protoporphyrinogen oxidase n=1 Tax=Kibdelosporangium aridum TaxID=2030 RepID=UPI0035E8E21D